MKYLRPEMSLLYGLFKIYFYNLFLYKNKNDK